MTYSIPGSVSALATKGPVRCIGPALDPDLARLHVFKHRLSDLEQETGAVFDRATVLVRSQVGPTIQELSDQIKIVRLDLHAVESCFQSILRRDAKIGYRPANFCFGHRAGSDSWLATRRGNAYLLRIHRRR